MKISHLHILGLLTFIAHSTHAQLPLKLEYRAVIATPNWFPTGPDGGSTDDATMPEDFDADENQKMPPQKQEEKTVPESKKNPKQELEQNINKSQQLKTS